MSYRITGVVGVPKKGGEIEAKRKTITTARTRKEAVHVARRIRNDRSSNFTKVRIEPVSTSEKKNDPFSKMDRESSAKKSVERRKRKKGSA